MAPTIILTITTTTTKIVDIFTAQLNAAPFLYIQIDKHKYLQ